MRTRKTDAQRIDIDQGINNPAPQPGEYRDQVVRYEKINPSADAAMYGVYKQLPGVTAVEEGREIIFTIPAATVKQETEAPKLAAERNRKRALQTKPGLTANHKEGIVPASDEEIMRLLGDPQ
jgi:hypothetical protein